MTDPLRLPWKIEYASGCAYIVDAIGAIVIGSRMSNETAKCIVTCVNFCGDVSSEELEAEYPDFRRRMRRAETTPVVGVVNHNADTTEGLSDE